MNRQRGHASLAFCLHDNIASMTQLYFEARKQNLEKLEKQIAITQFVESNNYIQMEVRSQDSDLIQSISFDQNQFTLFSTGNISKKANLTFEDPQQYDYFTDKEIQKTVKKRDHLDFFDC
ncbi:hypothetical protein BpHYR1_041406 [Brachionus plicatilis]|uniref:Uncharacterized protein n=1 Tax=Brachionus plicatilis TaxID=10195 RepID=A0A3M7QL87_BRAPC|nr:hypothetical protein BpHYR1_041406 [Brachionus plicatilis]